MARKRLYGVFLSTILLLCFSVTILPFDLLHTHAAQPVCEQVSQGKAAACHHKLHVSSQKPYCWLCAIHYDKTFVKASVSETVFSLPAFRILAENKVAGFFVQLIATSLRGPPAH